MRFPSLMNTKDNPCPYMIKLSILAPGVIFQLPHPLVWPVVSLGIMAGAHRNASWLPGSKLEENKGSGPDNTFGRLP